jgi:hypothetical protein
VIFIAGSPAMRTSQPVGESARSSPGNRHHSGVRNGAFRAPPRFSSKLSWKEPERSRVFSSEKDEKKDRRDAGE